MRGFVLSGVVVAAVLSGCFQKSDPPKERESVSRNSQAIQGGATDSTNKFAVGVCIGAAGECNGICSGALILPNVVATARHCVDGTPAKIDCTKNPSFGSPLSNAYTVTTNTTMDGAASGWYSVTSVAVPDDDHICGNDIALLVLSKSVPANVATPITPGVQYLMWDPVPNYWMAYSAIGYGSTSPAGGGSGTRRILNGIDVLCVPGSPDVPCPSEIHANEFVGSDGTCHGDSGSSAFESNLFAKGTPLSFGVLSRGDDSSGSCGLAIYSRFDAHRDFVLKTAKAASNSWTLYPEPSWTEKKPLAVAPTNPTNGGKKDAGSSEEEEEEGSTASAIGESCSKNADCKSGVCTELEDETSVCSKECEDSDGCPESFECRENLCLAPLPDEALTDKKTVTKTSCAAVSPLRSEGSWAAAAIAALGLAVVRRRRRAA